MPTKAFEKTYLGGKLMTSDDCPQGVSAPVLDRIHLTSSGAFTFGSA